MNRVAMWVGSALMAGTAGVFTVTAVFDIKPPENTVSREDVKVAVRDGVTEGFSIEREIRNAEKKESAAEIKRNKDRMWGRN